MTDACLAVNGAGIEYREFTCVYPALQSFYFDWEKNYDPVPVLSWMSERPWIPIVACLAYGAAILGGQAYFRTRDRWHWRTTLALWNAGLSLFSLVGLLRTLPQLVHNLGSYTLEENLCWDPQMTYGSGSTGLWVQLFILSKFPELVDTFFIIIHKKKLIFLHWYHHITVLLYCWHSYVTTSPPGIFFVVMNYGVHAIMYFYYCLMACHCKPKWLPPMVITAAQISQMVVGVCVTIAGAFISMRQGESCHLRHENNTAAFVMYGSYLFLFAQFFVSRYLRVNPRIAPVSASSSKSKKA